MNRMHRSDMTTRDEQHEPNCRTCGHSNYRPVRRYENCGYEVISKEEFYPALWRHGCPRHDDCRERMTFGDDELRCQLHGGTYRICEGLPIHTNEIKLYNISTHALKHISGDVDSQVDTYTIMSCPECDPSGYNCDPDGPVRDPCNSLYLPQDEEGRAFPASCRACGVSHEEYIERQESMKDAEV